MKNLKEKTRKKYEREFYELFDSRMRTDAYSSFGKQFKLGCIRKLVDDPEKYRFGLDRSFVDYESTEAFNQVEAEEYNRFRDAYVSTRTNRNKKESATVVEPILINWEKTRTALDSGMIKQTEFFKVLSERTDELLEMRKHI